MSGRGGWRLVCLHFSICSLHPRPVLPHLGGECELEPQGAQARVGQPSLQATITSALLGLCLPAAGARSPCPTVCGVRASGGRTWVNWAATGQGNVLEPELSPEPLKSAVKGTADGPCQSTQSGGPRGRPRACRAGGCLHPQSSLAAGLRLLPPQGCCVPLEASSLCVSRSSCSLSASL